MESWYLLSMLHKPSLLIFLMLLVFIVAGTLGGVNIEEDERKALLAIKESLQEVSYLSGVENPLPTWVDDNGGAYCDWERIKCDTTSRYVTHLSFSNIFSPDQQEYIRGNYWSSAHEFWPLNFSLFLQFKELTSLDLSWSKIGNIGLEGLSGLKKLEILNLSTNFIEPNIFRSLSELTSLKTLDLSYMNLNQYEGRDYSPAHDISIFQSLENLEVLDLAGCGFYGSLQIQVTSALGKLKVLNVGFNFFNESFVASLSVLPSLKALDLSRNQLSGPFPSQELSHLTHLEPLDLSYNNLNVTPTIQGCKSMVRLVSLESVSLRDNYFNKSIIPCLSFLPSLKILDLSSNDMGSSFPIQELSSLRELETLYMAECTFQNFPSINGTTMTNLLHLDLSANRFLSVDDVMRSMAAFPSLRYLSLEDSFQGGKQLFELPNLPDLEVLILRNNNFNGILPMEAFTSFHHLKILDLRDNNFSGSIPSSIKLLSSLNAVSFADNMLEGSLPNGMCELTNLQELDLHSNMFYGKLPKCFNGLSSLKFLDISSNKFMGKLPPSLFINLKSLEYVDFSHNEFEGSFLFSSFSNHTKLEYFQFKRDNDKFEVQTEEPRGWIPMFQLKLLVLSNWNIKGNAIPSFLFHQHKLQVLDLSHNSLEGLFPNWLIKNNSKLESFTLRNNSFHGVLPMPLYKNTKLRALDISKNTMVGIIPHDIPKFFPNIVDLNFSGNALSGAIPSSICDLRALNFLDLSDNGLSGEVPKGLLRNHSRLEVIKLSKNTLNGLVLSGNLSFDNIRELRLDNNNFTGDIGNINGELQNLNVLDISNNSFTGTIPSWVSNMPTNTDFPQLVVRHNRLEGEFPCGNASFLFLDLSQNLFSGPIPSCLNLEHIEHLHLSFNRFTGSIPNVFGNLTKVLTLDIGHNDLSGVIPEFLGDLSNLRVLLLGGNKFVGSIPKQLCRLKNVNLIDFSSNFLTGLIPHCLCDGPGEHAFLQKSRGWSPSYRFQYDGVLTHYDMNSHDQVEVQFTTKSNSLTYKGNILDYMSGVDLSCNYLTGEIPKEFGLLAHIHALNLSHNQLIGPIPVSFSNLTNIESMDLSSNSLSGKVPSELTGLTKLEVFDVSHNNLSGRLPEMKAQFATFTKESYDGNPLLCGPPLENKCSSGPHASESSNEEATDEKWYDIVKASFYASSGSIRFGLVLGFGAAVYINLYWCKRWMDFVEECMYTCYYFLYDLVRRPSVLFRC